jgi:site-specific recombinase XerD
MLEDMQMRNLAPLTQSAYVRAVAQLAQHYGKGPDRISREEVRAYLVELIQQRQVSASRYNQVRCALRFFYQVTLGREWTLDHVVCQKTGRKLPVVLSRAEVARFFGAIRRIKTRAVFMILYAAGLRVSEVVTLRVRDIDSQRMVIRVCQGKGKKDRYVMLSPKLLVVLRAYWRTCHPGAWLFAGQDRTRPLTCAAVRLACRRIACRAGLRKRVTPHTLRMASAYYYTF